MPASEYRGPSRRAVQRRMIRTEAARRARDATIRKAASRGRIRGGNTPRGLVSR
jgi:hypothetical protein